MPETSPSAVCPKCGRALHVNSDWLCPKCLLTSMLDGGALPEIFSTTANRPGLPRSFGAYELVAEVARGGMGVVYQARQPQANRIVAVKVLAAGQFAAPDFVKRFRTEAEAAASLDHPNIVPIYEVGECENQPFFSMKYVEGGSLAERIANLKSPITDHEAVELIVKLARAVHYAHQRGILHRDIKPGNVLLDARGEPYLSDFGLARLVEKNSTLTRTMAMLGTPSYMSPEQARGEAKQLTTGVDVYGLGAILYELLAGQPPFAGGTTMETVRQVLEKEPRRPSALKRGIDRDLETICLKCLEKDPARRYGSAEALAVDLEHWLRHEPILARPASPLERTAKWIRRNRAGFVAVVAIALLLVAGTGISTWQARVQRTLRGQAEANERAAQEARRDANAEAELRRQQLVRLHVAAGNKLVDEGDAFMGLLRFVEALRLEEGDAAREELHRRRFASVLRTAPRLKQIWTGSSLNNAGFSPDGTRVVCGDGQDGVQVFDAESGEPFGLPIKSDSPIRTVWFTPDGRFIATVDGRNHLRHWPLDRGGSPGAALPELRLRSGRHDREFVDYSVDLRFLAVALTEGVQVFDLATGQPVGPKLAEAVMVRRVRFSPDGKTLAISGERPDLQIVEVVSGREVWQVDTLAERRSLAAFSPDGARIVTSSGPGGGELDVWDIQRGERLFPTIQSHMVVGDVQFSGDGHWIGASGSIYSRAFDARLGIPALQPMWHRSHINRMEFSPRGHWLATASYDQSVRIWDVANGRSDFPALRHAHAVGDVHFSPDGGRLLTTCADAIVRLWEMPSGNGARLRLPFNTMGRYRVQVSPDGRRILAFGEKHLARVWDARTGGLLFAFNQPASVLSASFNRDGSQLGVAGMDGLVRFWNVESQEEIFSVQHGAAVRHVAFGPDGKRFLTASDDATARLWNSADGSPAAAAMVHPGAVRAAAFSPDGRHVVTGCHDGAVYVWSVVDGAEVSRLMTRFTTNLVSVALNADGARLLAISSGKRPMAQLWDATTGRPIGAEVHILSGAIYPAAFSRDGSRYLLLHDATSVAIMDAATGRRSAPLLRHERLPVWFAFSPDGRMVLTCEDTGARIWDTESGEPVTPPLRDAHVVTGGDWSPDGREVVTATYDGAVQVWDVSPDPSPVIELERKAELLTAHRLEPRAGAVPLRPEEVKARWRETRR